MPYIARASRFKYDPFTTHDREYGDKPKVAMRPGQLNFQITKLVNAYLLQHGISYETLNAIIGTFEAAKLEFYRRMCVQYENTKLFANGDVYGPDSN